MDIGTQTFEWRGCGEQSHKFRVYESGTDWSQMPEAGGVYIFACRENPLGEWVPLYIGETENFADDLPDHEMWSTLERQGNFRRSNIYVHVLEVRGKSQRVNVQDELIREHDPRWNSEIFKSQSVIFDS